MTTSTPSTPLTLSDLTDLGLVHLFLKEHAPHIRFVPTFGWLFWDSLRWQHDPDTAHLLHLLSLTLLAFQQQADDLPSPTGEFATAIRSFVARSSTLSRLKALLALASVQPAIRTTRAAFDAHPHLLTVANGTLDIRTGELTPHDPTHLLTRLIPFPYQPNATSSLWTDFLDQITNHQSDLIAYLQRAVGYSLSAIPVEGLVFLLLGSGRNGKRTFLSALSHALGDYAQPTPLSTFTSPPRSGPAATALTTMLPGTRLLTSSCVSAHQKLDLPTLTRLTASEPVVLPQGSSQTPIAPTFVTWLTARALPLIPDDLPASWHRLKIIPFPVCFAEQPSTRLLSHLYQAAPAILAWAVQGAQLWSHTGLHEPSVVRTVTTTYREELDAIAEFIRDCCSLDLDATVKAHELYLAYAAWSRLRNERPLTETAFLLQIQAHGYQRERKSSGKIYHGLALLPSAMPGVPGSHTSTRSSSSPHPSTTSPMPGVPGSSPSSPTTPEEDPADHPRRSPRSARRTTASLMPGVPGWADATYLQCTPEELEPFSNSYPSPPSPDGYDLPGSSGRF